MPSTNRPRFIYSLAGLLLHHEWTADALKTALKQTAVGDQPLRIPRLAQRLVAAFTCKPAFNDLAQFLRDDAGLARALSRLEFSSLHMLRRHLPRRPRMDVPPPGLSDIAIPDLPNEAALARWFGLDIPRLFWRADITCRNRKHPAGPLRTYRYRWIPKREGLPRLLEIPKAKLKEMQRKILEEILDAIPVHPAAHGFCRGRSIVSNAAAHCGKATVLRFDLVDFFPSVTSARVFRIFRTIGYPARVAQLLMGLCTTQLPADVWDARPGGRIGADFIARQRLITRHLPQGAPTSPALANLAAGRLDRRLSALAIAANATYTRYADDLIFSGDQALARSRKRLATLVAVIAHEEEFLLNHRKTRIMRSGVRQHVTGVVVNVRPNIPRAEFDRLKAILTNCTRHGPTSQNHQREPNFRDHLAGKIAHVASINPTRGDKLSAIFKRIHWETAN